MLTAADVPHNRYGLIEADQEVLCSERVRYAGDRVALVVAIPIRDGGARAPPWSRSPTTDLPTSRTPRQRARAGAPLVHPQRGTNVLLHQKIRKGDVERALAGGLVLSGTFTTSWQEHAYLQPDAGIAYYEGETLVVETAGQWLHEDRRQIAALLGLDETPVAIRYATIGGAFGGREDLSVQALLALATWRRSAPRRIVWRREESIVGHHKRHPFHITTTWGAKRDGTIVAVETHTVADGGAYASTSVEVLKCAAIFAQGPYASRTSRPTGRRLHQQRAQRRFPRFRRAAGAAAAGSHDRAHRARAGDRSRARCVAKPVPRRRHRGDGQRAAPRRQRPGGAGALRR